MKKIFNFIFEYIEEVIVGIFTITVIICIVFFEIDFSRNSKKFNSGIEAMSSQGYVFANIKPTYSEGLCLTVCMDKDGVVHIMGKDTVMSFAE